MDINIEVEIKGEVRRYSFYPNFIRNKDLRDLIKDSFFSNENRDKNINLIKKRHAIFIDEINVKNKTRYKEELIKSISNESVVDSLFLYHNIYETENVQFVSNLHCNMIKKIFKSNEIDLGIFLGFNPKYDFAYIVEEKDFEWFFESMISYSRHKYCKPDNYFRPYEVSIIESLYKEYKNGNIKSKLIIKSSEYNYTDIEWMRSELEDDEEELHWFFDEYDNNNVSDFELATIYISETKSTPYLTKKIVDELSFRESSFVKTLFLFPHK